MPAVKGGLHCVVVVVAAGALSGACAVGQKISYGAATPQILSRGATTVALAVQDRRTEVVSGKKAPTFCGLLRGGYGNPFDLTTESGRPLATDFTDAIGRGLASSGYRVLPVPVEPQQADGEIRLRLSKPATARAMLVQIVEWKSDTYKNTSLTYVVTARVLDAEGRVLGQATVSGTDQLGGSFAGHFFNTGGHAKRVLPAAYQRVLERVLNAPQILMALTARAAPPPPPAPVSAGNAVQEGMPPSVVPSTPSESAPLAATPPPAHAPPVVPGYGYPSGYAHPPGYPYPPGYAYSPGYPYPPPYPPQGYSPPHQDGSGPRAPQYGDHLHNGFYLRGGIGASFISGTVSNADARADFSGDIRGAGMAFDLAIGGTPVPGLVLGFGIYGNLTPVPTLESLGETGELVSVVEGPMIDVYPTPTKGIHLQAAAGVGLVHWSRGAGSIVQVPGVAYTGGGFGMMLGAGYQGWIGRQWSLGGMFRINWQSTRLEPEDPANRDYFVDAKLDLLSFSLLASLTFH
jgi:hypothetical protein